MDTFDDAYASSFDSIHWDLLLSAVDASLRLGCFGLLLASTN